MWEMHCRLVQVFGPATSARLGVEMQLVFGTVWL